MVIIVLVIALLVLGLGAALWSKYAPIGEESDGVAIGKDCLMCSGYDNSCEQECMLEAATKEIEYYDDEDLDAYKGRSSDSYTDDEADQFREVLYSMNRDEVAGWNRSLILREINIPNQVKDELILMIAR